MKAKKDLKVFRKNLFSLVMGVLCSSSLLAADSATTTQSNENLQQQLQILQQAIQTPTPAPAPATSSSVAGAPPANAPTTASAALPPPPSTTDNLPNPPSVSQQSGVPAQPIPNQGDSAEALLSGDDMKSQAFGKMLNTALPLSPAQIRLLRNMYDATQEAAVTFPGVPPRPTASSLVVNLSPGATPPVVRLSAGFVTSLVFVDSSGAPWPIDSYSLGNPTAFNIQWDKKSNILLVQAISAHRLGNLAVILKGLNTPVMVNLSPGQAAMDMRVDLRIPGFGPNAKPAFDTLPGTESPALLALLDGIPPPGAKLLKASACENCAWLVDKKLYLRTPFTILSPAWISTMSSADGTHVYEMQLTPLVLASYNGKTVKISIKGF